MNKNLEELKWIDIPTSTKMEHRGIKLIIKILDDFEKRLTELEKYKSDILGYYEINETGGVNNIKIGGTD